MTLTQKTFDPGELGEAFALPPAPAERTEPAAKIAPEVQREFNRLALVELAKGKNWIGAKALGEDLRRWSRIHCNGRFKINNNQISKMARRAEEMHPELRGLFKHRKPKEN